MLPPNTQFDRYIRLIVGPSSGGTGMDLSQFRIRFHVNSAVISTPNSLYVRISNLGASTARAIQAFNPSVPGPIAGAASAVVGVGKTTGQVVLEAGYKNAQRGVIFSGDIVMVELGRENKTDTYCDIYARDGDMAHVWSMMSSTLAAGYTPNDLHNRLSQSFNRFGVTPGQLPSGIDQRPAPRGKTMFGMTRDYLDDFARTYEMTWSVDKGQLVYIPYRDFRQGQAIRLDERSGLIGMPKLTQDGVCGRCLLNPAITFGTRLQIAKSDIQLPQFQQQWTTINYFPGRDSLAKGGEGFFKVLQAQHIGDTRGNEWLTEFTCIALDSTQLPMTTPQTAIPP